ncbi:hypothetical protein EV175_003905, partial [Coemansia sp. RSA 1933]
MTDAQSSSPAALTTSTAHPPDAAIRLDQTVRAHRGSEGGTFAASPRPSPYTPKVQPASFCRSSPESSAGIGGPPKRRESMSGIGNNLRSNNPAGLGRGVGRYKNVSSSPDQGPSGISNLLRRRSSYATTGSPPANKPPMPAHNPRRRGSTNTASPITANTSTHYSRSTIFPMNHTALADSRSPQQGLCRRRTTLAIHRPKNAPLSPTDRPAFQQSHSLTPAYVYPANPLSVPAASPRQRLPFVESQQLSIAQVAFSSPEPPNIHVDERHDSSSSPAELGMTVGSPNSGKVIDVVGSFASPSIVYAPVRKYSKIGGAEKGKETMQHSHGIGGSYGKDWMADRPSGIGAAVSQGAHPESGISKALKTLGIK